MYNCMFEYVMKKKKVLILILAEKIFKLKTDTLLLSLSKIDDNFIDKFVWNEPSTACQTLCHI